MALIQPIIVDRKNDVIIDVLEKMFDFVQFGHLMLTGLLQAIHNCFHVQGFDDQFRLDLVQPPLILCVQVIIRGLGFNIKGRWKRRRG